MKRHVVVHVASGIVQTQYCTSIHSAFWKDIQIFSFAAHHLPRSEMIFHAFIKTALDWN